MLSNASRLQPRNIRKFIRHFSQVKSDISDELLVSASMSWMSDKPTTQLELADALKRNNLVYTPEVYEVFKKVDRALFCNDTNENPYSADPDLLDHGQKLTSPVMQAIALEVSCAAIENLFAGPNTHPIYIADIGFGYGCTTAMLTLLTQYVRDRLNSEREIKVFGYEIYKDFVDIGYKSISSIPEIDMSQITLEHKDIQVEKVSEKFDFLNSACAFYYEGKSPCISSFITPMINPEFTSTCLIPVIRPDGEQDLTLFRYDPSTEQITANVDSVKDPQALKTKRSPYLPISNFTMRALFTEAKAKMI
ncbi:unnamed protein product [Moneuplotes crassus]|uniref:protein-L-isoaspartate(D-aspartate) O-methyltransferase n=1 Tax=Euplotes crassus TaxID=5936 RepID=A0AAD2D0Z6_EUPCR|nr:unnamed protein product [Moneuplotes crassus]